MYVHDGAVGKSIFPFFPQHFILSLHCMHITHARAFAAVFVALLPFFLINMKRINAAGSKRNNVKLQMHL